MSLLMRYPSSLGATKVSIPNAKVEHVNRRFFTMLLRVVASVGLPERHCKKLLPLEERKEIKDKLERLLVHVALHVYGDSKRNLGPLEDGRS